MNLQNEKKRKGGAARLRDKNKKKLIETSSKCYNIEQMFTKKNALIANIPVILPTPNNTVLEPNNETCSNAFETSISKDNNLDEYRNESNIEDKDIIEKVIDISLNKNHTPQQPMLNLFPRNPDNRSFNANYYKLYNWIEYSVLNDAVYCFACRHFSTNKCIRGQYSGNYVFINRGFNGWKKQSVCLKIHNESDRHKSSIEKWTLYLSTKQNDSSTLYLAKQGLAFRGHNEERESLNRGNFIELLETFGDKNTILKMQSRYGHYTSHEYQNDLISVIASSTKNIILNNMSEFSAFSILVDETKDASKKEQLSFLIRFIDKNYNIQEKALGCYHMEKCDADSLSKAILKIVSENKLDINRCVAQCYDGASVMSGSFTGVQKRIADIVPQAIFIHCYAHRLNLCLLNSIQDIRSVVNFFDTIQGIYTYLMNSQTRYELFTKIQKDKKIKVLHLERLVETRWSYWYTSLQKIKQRYSEIKEVLTILTLQGDQTARAFKSTKKDLQGFRNEETFLRIYDKSKLFAKKNGLANDEVRNTRLKRNCTLNKNLDDYLVDSTLGKTQNINTTQNVKSEVFYAIIDRSSMGDKRLSDLMVIAVEKEDANKIDLDKAVDVFSKLKTRRYKLE
ncbi:zinc finger MYM-type protein 1-like [Melanaphis sacchari]|uniref:zinc finger MYM-type protein 1-like n=1 Tax=Melanaphis sacchari TaxID=742174 RepID=UPI000DC14BD6|nr:zinc finger MYM-type protein 1-like [Melanaphis sacchari]